MQSFGKGRASLQQESPISHPKVAHSMVHNANRAKSDVPLLSVVMPVYNEIATIHEIILRVLAVDLDKELIIVDDCSTDGTREYLKSLALSEAGDPSASEKRRRLRIFFQDRNYGKGAALRKGFEQAIGQIVVIQDADLELNPQEYGKLIKPIQLNVADIVYGSRFLEETSEVEATPNYWGNKMLTAASNLFTGLKLTDVWTCYKTFRREILDGIELRENRFAFEPEFTAKVANRSWRITEVPVSYAYRSQKQGKKISWRDGFRGIACTVYYGAACLILRLRIEKVVSQITISPVSQSVQIGRSTLPPKG
jgi:glycosyltransferase involved in cell wall biosynthesis